jgi:threonine dehydrogenase-like Zn-dependent dehydrogenase
MRDLYFDHPGKLAFRDSPRPVLSSPTDARVRPLIVARCDLDAAIVWGRAPFRGKGLHWLRRVLPHRLGRDGIFRKAPFCGPFSFGHECVAEVLEVGSEVRTVGRGDVVVVPFQIACGTCGRCRRGVTAACEAVPLGASFGLGRGWGGVLADEVIVPFADAMLLPAPAGVPLEYLASAGDNIADGVRTVAAPLSIRPGADVLVVGGQAASVGLYAVAAARALGAGAVTYLDQDQQRLGIAERLGATVVDGPYRPLRRHAITVDASADPRGLSAAIRSTEPGGTSTSVGIYFAAETPFPLLPAFMNGITFVTSRVSSRETLPLVLRLLAAKTLAVDPVTTTTATWEEAPEAFLEAGPKVLVRRESSPRVTRPSVDRSQDA